MNEDLYKRLNEMKIDIPQVTHPASEHFTKSNEELDKNHYLVKKELIGKKAQSQIDSVRLKQIEESLGGISDWVHLLQKNVQKQDEILEVLIEILSISKAETVEDADSRYRRIMDKVNAFKDDFDTFKLLTTTVKGVLKLKLSEWGVNIDGKL